MLNIQSWTKVVMIGYASKNHRNLNEKEARQDNIDLKSLNCTFYSLNRSKLDFAGVKKIIEHDCTCTRSLRNVVMCYIELSKKCH